MKNNFVLTCLLLGMLFSCSNKPPYSVSIGNYTGQGIIFYDLPVATETLWKEKKVYPTIPGSISGLSKFPNFLGSQHSLPNQITIKWQLAKLNDCKQEEFSRELDGYSKEVSVEINPNVYAWKMDCEWFPLESKKFETTVDLRSFQKSEPFLELGKRHKSVQMSRNTAGIFMAFYGEDDLRIKTYSGHSKTWQ